MQTQHQLKQELRTQRQQQQLWIEVPELSPQDEQQETCTAFRGRISRQLQQQQPSEQITFSKTSNAQRSRTRRTAYSLSLQSLILTAWASATSLTECSFGSLRPPASSCRSTLASSAFSFIVQLCFRQLRLHRVWRATA